MRMYSAAMVTALLVAGIGSVPVFASTSSALQFVQLRNSHRLYLQWHGALHWIPSGDLFLALGGRAYRVHHDQRPLVPITWPVDIIRQRRHNQIYRITGNMVQPISSLIQLRRLGFRPDQIVPVNRLPFPVASAPGGNIPSPPTTSQTMKIAIPSATPTMRSVVVAGSIHMATTSLTAGQSYMATLPDVPSSQFTFWFLSSGSQVYPLLSGDTASTTLTIPTTVSSGAYTLVASVGTTTGYRYYGLPVHVSGNATVVTSVAWMVRPATVYQHYDMLRAFQVGDQGQGQTIALWENSDVKWADVAAFDQMFGLPAPHVLQFTMTENPGITSAQDEATLDIEWVHAMAPRATIDVLIGSGTPDSFNHAMGDAERLGATAFSLSYGGNTAWNGLGYLGAPADNLEIEMAAKTGLGIFVAAGDHGKIVPSSASEQESTWPASNEYTVAVGGTMLVNGQDVYWNSGTEFGAGAYGYTHFPMAKWQADEWVRLSLLKSVADALIPGLVHRWVPDVSFLANNVPIMMNGAIVDMRGTSLAAPCWASVWALTQQHYHALYGVRLTNPPTPSVLYAVANDPGLPPAYLDQSVGAVAPFYARIGFGPPDVYNFITDVSALYY